MENMIITVTVARTAALIIWNSCSLPLSERVTLFNVVAFPSTVVPSIAKVSFSAPMILFLNALSRYALHSSYAVVIFFLPRRNIVIPRALVIYESSFFGNVNNKFHYPATGTYQSTRNFSSSGWIRNKSSRKSWTVPDAIGFAAFPSCTCGGFVYEDRLRMQLIFAQHSKTI